jgi:glycosyltransferase involved in cell wall biosynthesis
MRRRCGERVVRRIAFAVPGDLATPTGGYAYDRRMIAELEKLGWQIDVVDLGEGFPWPSNETRANAWLRLSDIPAGRTIVIDGLAFGVLPEAVLQLRVENPLIALVHHPLALEAGLSAQQVNILRTCERAALGAARLVIANSAETARHLTRDYGVTADRIVIACPGTDPAPMAPGSRDGVVRLISVGALVPRKGFDVLLAALATLTELPWHLTIAGDRSRDPQTAAKLDADIVRLKLADRVTVLGAVPDEKIAELYAGADLFTLASRYEGYGMAFSEALARGIPVIATTAGAIPETVPAEAGLLVPPDDTAAFAAALRTAIGNSDERQRMATAARAAALKLPAWSASAKLFSDALEAVS